MSAANRIKELTRPTGEEDILAVSYPQPRLRVELKQALAVALVAVAGVAGWALTRPPAEPEPDWTTVAADTHVAQQVVVAVVGEVANPGLVTLNEGSRVADALAVAQPHPDADLLALNLAQVLVDGQQILVPPPGQAHLPPGSPGTGAAPGTSLVSINAASAAELTALPGVGEATAAAIVAHRDANGPFATLEALMDVKGIGPAKFAALREQIVL